MKREGTIGAATLLAIAAVVGASLQSGPKPDANGKADQTAAIKRVKRSVGKKKSYPVVSACDAVEERLEDFLEIDELLAPDPSCYGPTDSRPPRPDLTAKTSQLKFVIATLPDPAHTHLPVIFDRFAVAIQEGAQDEKYEFDSSWLPWDDEESPYALLDDQKRSNEETELKESQPGIILFRKTIDCTGDPGKRPSDCEDTLPAAEDKDKVKLSQSFRAGLIVFVVGEDATHGIHRDQFRNALAWIRALKPKHATKAGRVAILGPTFSGSLSSVAQVLSEPTTRMQLDLPTAKGGQRLAIFSGSVSGNDSAMAFQGKFQSQVTFHSFVQNDDEILRRFCDYLAREQPGFDANRVAIISEDETAYGSNGVDETANATAGVESKNYKKDCRLNPLRLQYPRDISALRDAYQTKSLFNIGASAQPADTQRRSLPTDLADPSGKVRDSIRSYGGNQTPLTQEAILLQIVSALRELNARYVLLRGSNALDQLFLTNFLRRGYPDARIVIFSSDLMFIRESGSTGLSGVMALSTYPLFPLERDWTEHQSLPAADRVFSSDTTEGTYVALRLLLNDPSLVDGKPDPKRCHVVGQSLFVPSIGCQTDPPIPDYSAPFWTLADQCGEVSADTAKKMANQYQDEACPYRGPATWLSVIGSNRFWPMASLTPKPDPKAKDAAAESVPKPKMPSEPRKHEPGEQPTIPVGMRVFLFALVGFSLFHASCCWFGSYTAKPAFRAHFATTGDWRHARLVFGGSCCVAFLALVAGWGCGIFSTPAPGLTYPWFALAFVSVSCMLAWGAILASNRTAWKLSRDLSCSPDPPRMTRKECGARNYRESGLFLAAIALFCLVCVLPIELQLLPENRVLTYWRSMHLLSGVSPIVPILLVLAGVYVSFWFTLHGLALFGPDRPCLPPKEKLAIEDAHRTRYYFLRMFSQEDAAAAIEKAAKPLNVNFVWLGVSLVGLFFGVACWIAGGVPVRSLGGEFYSVIFLLFLDVCCAMAIVETWRLCQSWDELKKLLAFLDRLPLRRTLAALRGFSWGGVWRMSGNVLEVRYKVISRQMECMNHTITSLQEFLNTSSDPSARTSLAALLRMRRAGTKFAKWYSDHYMEAHAGDLSSFSKFQQSISSASGTLLAKLLVPAWRLEEQSLVVESVKDEHDEAGPTRAPQPEERHICNAEEFVCLNYLGFIQNILGRLRTMVVTIMLLLLVSTVATSTYPFDPQQALSAVLIVLFVSVGAVIVRVYADMHRDSTLSHVTNTRPGELGTEFWFKIVGFGFAPLIGLLTRLFPGITDFVFSWLQPGIASLK